MNNFYPGVDIVDVDRIKSSIEKYQDKFLTKVFSKEEQVYCNSKSNPFVHFSGKCVVKTGSLEELVPICSALLDAGLSAEIS